MKHKASIMRYLIVAMLTVMCAVLCFVGCKDDTGGKTDAEHTVTWEVAEHATVKAEGYDTLPEKVKDGTAIVFTIECDSGYEVDTVKRSDRNVTASNGKYTVTVTADVKISVTVKEQLKAISVTTKPTKLTYYAGEALDKAGMVVEAEYATGTKKAITDYRIVYPTENATCFYLGEKSFTVTYGGMTSAAVELAAPVEAKITINPVAGTISEDVLNEWKENEELKDVKVDAETGVVTFTYAALTEPITLPTGKDLPKRSDLGDINFTFVGWAAVEGDTITGLTSITVENRNSLEIEAQYNADLVTFKSADLKMVGEVPTLEVTFTAEAMSGAYLFLYEGNQKFSVKGDAVSEKSGNVTVNFDLRKLSSAKSESGASFAGAWMDIRIALDVNGATFSNLMVIDPENVTVDVGKMIHNDDYCYRFIHYVRSETGEVELKVYFNRYAYTYEMALSETGGKPTLTLTGTINTKLDPDFKYDGADVSVAFGSYAVAGKVKADGTWTATLDLSTVTENANLTASNITVTASDGSTLDTLYVEASSGSKTSLDLIGCGTIFEDFDPTAGNNRNYSTSLDASNGWHYTIGTDWNEPFFIATDVAHEIVVKGADLDVQDGTVYLVLTGTYGEGFTTADEVKAAIYLDIQSNSDAGSPDGWDVYWNSAEDNNGMQLTATGGTWTLRVAIPEAAQEEGVIMFSHFGDANTNLVLPGLAYKSVVAGKFRYTLSAWTGWGSQLLSIAVTDPSKQSITVMENIDVELVVDGGKPCIVVTVSATGYTADTLKAAVQFGNWEKSDDGTLLYEWWTSCVKVVADGDNYKLYFDLTGMKVFEGDEEHGKDPDTKLWSNLRINGAEEKTEIHDNDLSSNGKTISVNGKKYTIICTGDNGTWRIPCITVEDDEASIFPEDATYTLTDVDLIEEGGKPYFVLKGTYENCTKEQLKAELEIVHFDLETNANMGASGWVRKSDYPRTVETTDDGWTIKIDISSLTQPATPHFTAENGDIKLDTEHAVHDKAITVGIYEYKIFNKPVNDDADHNFWGNVGLMVTSSKTIAVDSVDLTLDETSTKVYYSFNVTFTGFTAEELGQLSSLVTFGDTNEKYPFAKVETVDANAHTYKFYFDVTAKEGNGGWLWVHAYVNGNSTDIKDENANGKSVQLNGKTYKIQANGETYSMAVLIVTTD